MDRLLDYIGTRSLPPGSRLPSEREFTRLWNATRPAMSKAIAGLIAQGHLRREGYKLSVAPALESPAAPTIHVLHPHHQSQESSFIRERLIEAAHDVAHAFNSHTIPILAHTPSQQRRQLADLLKSGTPGFILWPVPGASVTDLLDRFTAQSVPFITCDLDFGHPYFVGTDNEAGMPLAVNHLHALGHRRIAYVTQSLEFVSLQHRCEGYKRGCAARGLTDAAKAIVEVPSSSPEHARHAWQRLRTRHRGVTAICCSNDLLALRIMDCAQNSGLQIPRDLSIVGFDDIEPASFAKPALTTIAQDFYQLGVLAAQMLYQRLRASPKAPDRPIRIRLEPYLIERQSAQAIAAPKKPNRRGPSPV